MQTASDQPCRLGIVGGGLIAQLAHLPVLAGLPGEFELVALSEPSARIRSALARRYGLAVHAGHEHMLERERLDAVLVCSPNESHAGVVLDAVARGLHVLVEKPLCLDPDDGAIIAAAAREAGVVVQVGYMKRHAAELRRFLDGLPPDRALLRIDTMTVDPGIGERFRPRAFVAAGDVPRAVLEHAERELLEQAGRAASATTLAGARAYSGAFAGALVHDVNLVHAVLDRLGRPRGAVLDATGRADGSLAGCLVDLGEGARWSSTWLYAPAAPAFTEVLTCCFEDRPRRLSFPSPYADVRSTYRAQLSAFRAALRGAAPCVTPPEQATDDLALLAEAYRRAQLAVPVPA